MSDQITDLLERATPPDVDHLDYGDIATRGTRRRWAKRLTGTLGGVLALAGGIVGALQLAEPPAVSVTAQQPDTPASSQAGETAGPSAAPAEPTGSWDIVLDGLPTGGNDAFVDVASDGRLVVHGGRQGTEGAPEADGVVIDPDSGATTPIPAPPLTEEPMRSTAFAADRLLVFGGAHTSPTGAWYDLATEQWTALPPAPTDGVGPNLQYWDGTHAVLGSSYRSSPEGEEIIAPELWRWTVGAASWERVETPPVDVGIAEWAMGDGVLALWSNPVPDPVSDSSGPRVAEEAVAGDSRLAFLDVGAGSWSTVARDQLPGAAQRAGIGWLEDRLAVVPLPPQAVPISPGGATRRAELPTPIAVEPATGSVEALQPIPEQLRNDDVTLRFGSPMPHLHAARPLLTVAGPPGRAALLPDGTWTAPAAALHGLHSVGGRLVALHADDGDALAARVWTGTEWQPAADPGSAARSGATVVAGPEALYLVGGWSVDGTEPSAEEGATGPGPAEGAGERDVTLHHDVLRFTP